MKKKIFSKLRYNLWLFFIMFAILIIVLLWVFQIVLFDNIYQNDKNNTIIKTGQDLSNKINDGDESSINEWLDTSIRASEKGIVSYIVSKNGTNYNEITYESIYSSFFDSQVSMTEEQKNDQSLISNSLYKFDNESNSAEYICYRYNDDNGGGYVYVTKVSNSIVGNSYLVLKSSQQSLVETISVIQRQLIIVTLCIIVISFFLSWYISGKLSKPITTMSDTAKKWAQGDGSVTFNGDSYFELKELADALNYAKEGISQTDILQRDLLANVSHDLKTPLTMIKAYAEMIRDLSGNIKEKRDLHTKVIIDETDRLTMLVNDILDLSKLQNGMNNMVMQNVNISDLCESVVNQFNDFANSNGYTIEQEIEKGLIVCCDKNKIKQVFYNLIGNSINYTGADKHILVKLSKKEDKIVFESVDSGKGISKENVNTIWEKYYRFSETHQRPVKGTGLGLSIVKTILESHRVKFGVISKKDVGSNFFIEFDEVKLAGDDNEKL